MSMSYFKIEIYMEVIYILNISYYKYLCNFKNLIFKLIVNIIVI